MEKHINNKETGQARPTPRESDNPIVEEYKEDLLRKPTYSPRSVSRLLDEEERMTRVEKLVAELGDKIASIEKRIENLEKSKIR
jgi:hypothetical protein